MLYLGQPLAFEEYTNLQKFYDDVTIIFMLQYSDIITYILAI